MNFIGFICVIIGMLFVNMVLIYPKVKSFAEISISKWWTETRIRFMISLIIVSIVYYMSWYYGTISIERCFYLGIIGNLIVDRIIKANAQSNGHK